MSETHFHALVERLNKLERQNRTMRAALSAVAVIVCGAVAIAAAEPVPEVVRAREFQVVDAAGKLQATLFVRADGASGLNLFDATGKQGAVLHIADGVSGLNLFDATGRTRADLAVTPEWSGLNLFDPAGKPKATLRVASDGVPQMALRDAAGKDLFKAP